MADISRRDALIFSAALALATAVPARVAEAVTAAPMDASVMPAWAVGPMDDWGWDAIRAPTEEAARRLWAAERCGQEECQEGRTGEATDECDCEFCWGLRRCDAQRVASWDAVEVPSRGDWIRAGLGAWCTRCNEETFAQAGAQAIGGDAICEECMTLADWDVVDPTYAAELRAELSDEATA